MGYPLGVTFKDAFAADWMIKKRKDRGRPCTVSCTCGRPLPFSLYCLIYDANANINTCIGDASLLSFNDPPGNMI